MSHRTGKHLARLALAASALFSALGAQAAGNLVVNGDFETHSIITLGNGTYHCYRNNTFHGWTQTSVDTSFGSCFHRGGRDNFPPAYSGGVFMYVNDGGDINESIGQSILLAAGTRYELSFASHGYLPRSAVGPLEVDFGTFETLLGARATNLGWQTHSFIYTPTSSGNAWLSFTSRSITDPVIIDAVSVVELPPVPEPGTYALMALGLGAVGLAARRRRARSA